MCDNNFSVKINNNYSFWENHSTSRDEKEIINYLNKNLNLIINKKILHIGIGNSEFAIKFSKYTLFIDGITISGKEKINATKYNCYRNIHICNKYNLNDMKTIIKDNYDLIIDQGIKCYTCCQPHFEELFKFYILKLLKNGLFITSNYGMNWSGYPLHLRLKKKLIKDDTNKDKSNILGIDELNTLVKKYNLKINKNQNIIFIGLI